MAAIRLGSTQSAPVQFGAGAGPEDLLGGRGIEVEVIGARVAGPGVLALRLRSADGATLPDWKPGSHIDVATPFGLRQYSLVGGADGDWQIAVQEETGGTGGSRWLHANAAGEASRLVVSVPRDSFGFAPAEEYLFIAGGIGITPILPMYEWAVEAGTPSRLVYTARASGGHSFLERLTGRPGVTCWTSSEQGRLALRELLESAGETGRVFCCGPSGMIDEVRALAQSLGLGERVHTERFEASAEAGPRAGDEPFAVQLARSGAGFEVGPEENLLDRLALAGVFVPSSCRAGICGSCEIGVIDGEVDHRDEVLTEAERARHDCMFPCVSRAAGDRLILDL